MSLGKDTDLKSVVRLVHQKGVVTAAFLRKQGVSYQRMLKFRQANWLTPLGVGAFCESGSVPSLDVAFVALSEQLGLPVHFGSKTALARRGLMHYVPLGGLTSEVYLRRGSVSLNGLRMSMRGNSYETRHRFSQMVAAWR